MAKVFKYKNYPIFELNEKDHSLNCSYCSRHYVVNNLKIKQLIGEYQKNSLFEFKNLHIRCIYCDLYSEKYPFKYQNPSIQLNQGQKLTIEKLYQQMLITNDINYHQSMFLVEGYAGTGKTTLITHLLKYPEFDDFRICFAAPTNIALNVLMDKLNDKMDENTNTDVDLENNDKKFTFKTAFKLFDGKFIVDEFGETVFNNQSSDKFKSKYNIIIIDEVSMIDKKQINHLLTTTSSIKKGHAGPIIIFLGDEAQLPPVNEDCSAIFSESLQQKHQIVKLTLTEIMRSQNKLTELSLKVRELIPLKMEDKISKDLSWVNFAHFINNEITHCNDKTQWINDYAQTFKNNLKTQKNKSRTAPIMLVYTNYECQSLNEDCRNLIFDNPTEKYIKSELLVFNQYYSLSRQRKCANQSLKNESYYLKFFISEPIIVSDVMISNQTIADFKFANVIKTPEYVANEVFKKFNSSKLPKSRKDLIIAEIKSLVSKWSINTKNNTISSEDQLLDRCLNKICQQINSLNHHYDVHQLYVDVSHKLDPLDTQPEECYLSVIKENSRERYDNNCQQIKEKIRSGYEYLTRTYQNNQSLKLFINQVFSQIWLHYYYRTYIWPFADLSYGYAITTHKSQGSTFENTYVNIQNIMSCKKVNNIVKFKSLYTAITRASKKINIFYHKITLLPLYPFETPLLCHLCQQRQMPTNFPSLNWTIDRNCADRLLNQIGQMSIYEPVDKSLIYYSDKHKNIYEIQTSQIESSDLNCIFDYLKTNQLNKNEIDKYQYSNLVKVKTILDNNLLSNMLT